MTAPRDPDTPGHGDLREQLAYAVHLRLNASSSGHEPWECESLADALLPLVVGYGNQRAAEALEKAAEDYEVHGGHCGRLAAQNLRIRAVLTSEQPR